jgi:hypothetical protein
MERTQVSSTNLASVGYDSDSSVLEVEFNGGGIYQYYDVPAGVFDELMGAGSLGSYLHHNIKSVYSCSKV